MTLDGPVLIAYDGSEDARHAIDDAGSLHVVQHSRRPALVVPSPSLSAARARVADEIPDILRAQTVVTR